MNFPLYIAKRYLFSKKSKNVINIISIISIVGVAVGTSALIIVLSVFNGFDGLISNLFNSFDPDLKITSAEGKSFIPNSLIFDKIKTHESVAVYSEVVEETVLFKFNKKQHVGTLKGVDDQFTKMSGVDTMMVDGKFLLKDKASDYAVVGQGVAYYLSMGLNMIHPLSIYVPRKTKNISLDADKAFNNKLIMPIGVFATQPEIDVKYVLAPITFVRDLLQYSTEVTGIELKLKEKANQNDVQKIIKEILGDKFIVKTRYQQHEVLYKIMESEKWAIFLILTFILIIASFNTIGSLTMLILDKKKDIGILQSMGANFATIRKIFLIEGWLISIFGAFIGIFVGGVICWLQEYYGLIPLSTGGNFIIQNYPVKMIFTDFIYVFFTVAIVGFFAAWYPVRYITKKYL